MEKHRSSPLSSNKQGYALGLFMTLALVAGCQKQPGGQVVAVANNDEITMQELNTEAQAARLPAVGDKKPQVAALLQRVIDRNLLADYARSEGLDRGPEYVARKRQMDQTLLADLAARKLAGPAINPTPAEISAYIAAHPLLFAERQRLTLDQVRFVPPAQADALKAITDMPTLEGVIDQLNTRGIKYQRGVAALDTGSIDPGAVRQILALKPGEAFALTAGGQSFVSVITDRKPVSLDGAATTELARNAMRSERLNKVMTDSLKKLRGSAKIEYDPAFKPAK